jgi:hypothetical protein
MNEKYYTPDISEFHVGFECEIRMDEFKHNNWKTIKVDHKIDLEKNTISMLYVLDCLSWDYKTFRNENIRVKYLDSSDIESLGFELTGSCFTEANAKIAELFSLYNPVVKKEYRITYNYMTKIATIDDSIDGNVLFKGTIENISELKKILTQVKVL